MKHRILSTVVLSCAASCLAQEAISAKQLQSIPKNLARQHLQANLMLFDSATKTYVATEAAAAWLDDDVATGWPALAGKQHYLLGFTNSQVISNFGVLAAPTDGTITIYTSDEVKSPGDPSWRVIAKDIPLASINQKKLEKPFNREAKAILIETNFTNPGPIFSLYAYGNRSAVNDSIQHRAKPVDVASVFGEFVNQQTSFNVSSIYAGARVTYSNSPASQLGWQKSLDENPETASPLKAGADSSVVVNFREGRTVSRMSILADGGTRGKVDVYLLAEAPTSGHPVALEGVQPSVTLAFDGSNPHASADFDDTTAVAVALRWTPEKAGAELNLRELNTFANLPLSDYEVAPLAVPVGNGPVAVNETPADDQASDTAASDGENTVASAGTGVDGKSSKEIVPIGAGPEKSDYKGGGGKTNKEMLPPVGAPPQSGYFPGGLGFPPNVSSPRTPPERRPSP